MYHPKDWSRRLCPEDRIFFWSEVAPRLGLVPILLSMADLENRFTGEVDPYDRWDSEIALSEWWDEEEAISRCGEDPLYGQFSPLDMEW